MANDAQTSNKDNIVAIARRCKSALLLVSALGTCSAALLHSSTVSFAQDLKVVATIKPIHSLVSAIMEGVATPEIILDKNASPHGFSLSPSKATLLENADLIFWMGPELESFMVKPIKTIANNAQSITLSKTDIPKTLPLRDNEDFEAHNHDDDDDDDHGHAHHDEKHDDHESHSDEHDHDHDDHEGHEGHSDHDDHKGDATDLHQWLNTQNAKAFAHTIEDALSAADPENSAKYEANLAKLDARLDDAGAKIEKKLHSIEGLPFMVFHDAYQYFEDQFDLNNVGSITLNPDVKPSLKRMQEISDKIAKYKVVCIFSEPQFDGKLVQSISAQTGVATNLLDPLGGEFEQGSELYFQMMDSLATSLHDCLTQAKQ